MLETADDPICYVQETRTQALNSYSNRDEKATLSHYLPGSITKNCHNHQMFTQNTGFKFASASGGSRNFLRGYANPQNTIILQIFCRKLHKNERIRTRGEGGLDPPMLSSIHYCQNC